MSGNVEFAYPYVLYLLLLMPLMLFWYWKKNQIKSPDIIFSSLKIFKGISATLRERLRHLPAALRVLGISFLIVALARPQSFTSGEKIYTEGIDIAILLDISGSMLAEDFKPNRLEAAKEVIDNFIKGRTNDKIGLVVFQSKSFTQCPLTIDYSVLRTLLKEVKSGIIQDGTAIGTAIANGVNRLKNSKSKSKVIILLTDGVNNSGEIDPVTAAQIAKKFGIRIYTIGVGTIGTAPFPYQTPFGKRYTNIPVEIDEDILKQVSKITGGKYFRATDKKKLEEIYKEIDKMEKSRIEVTSYKHASELFYKWAALGLIFILFEFGLTKTYLRRLP